MPNKSIMRIEHLSHRYSSQWAIRDINIEINDHGVLGLLGSNGAGKSTTMNILCGVLKQTEGDVYIDGISMREQPERAKMLIGFLPQEPPLHFDLTVDEYLTHCAHLRRMDPDEIPGAVAAAKEWTGITRFSNRLIRNLSGGYRQRTGIAQAIVHKPKLVVLDEPTTGLDPNQITEVRKLIAEIGKGRAVLLCTHILSEVQAMCQDIKMIEEGRVVFSDTIEAFNNYIEPNTLLAVMDRIPADRELLSIDGITRSEVLNGNKVRLHFDNGQDITKKVIRASVAGGWELREINLEKGALDAVFAQLSNKNSNANAGA